MFDIFRIAAAVPRTRVGDVAANTTEIINFAVGHGHDAAILAFPALSMTGASCGDLFLQSSLYCGVRQNLARLLQETENIPAVLLVGAPLLIEGRLYHCAVALKEGRILGVVPKTHLSPSEKRCFSSRLPVSVIDARVLGAPASYPVPCGKIVFDGGVKFAVELGADAFSPIPSSAELALSGAELIIHLSDDAAYAKSENQRKNALCSLSARLLCGYVSVSAGADESTTDAVYPGHILFAACGNLLCENKDLPKKTDFLETDIDLGMVRAARLSDKTFGSAGETHQKRAETVSLPPLSESDGGCLQIEKTPFLPTDPLSCRETCMEIFALQTAGLQKRLETVGGCPCIGVSGGLDSTLALLVSANAMQKAGRAACEVLGVTMPCFGTTDRTRKNAVGLMDALGISAKTVSIGDAVRVHFRDIEHDENQHDTTYENAQARERTQVLMDMAGKHGGFVVGTGDLSELALGWCTYNGDHMSNYGVNAGVPKTLLSAIIKAVRDENLFPAANEILTDILNTPISPELLPPDANGEILQKTEEKVGPYILHDFFLYYTLCYGFSPSKIFFLAKRAFGDTFPEAEILFWLRTFFRRFFSQQFKRSAMPDGVQVLKFGLSPRGSFQMPSDAVAALWLAELDALTS